jgi:hypothetical protein
MSHERDDIVTVGGTGRLEKSRRIAIGAAVAVVAMLGGAVVAFAATNATASPTAKAASPSSSPSQKPLPKMCPNTNAPCRRFAGPFHMFGVPPGVPFGLGFPGGMFGAVHGQMVLAKPGGGYQTVDIQRGKVTAVSQTSISVRSSDGFTASYAVAASTVVDAQRDGIGSVKVGNQVAVFATVSGSKATATSITDVTLLQQGRGSDGFGWSSVS